MNAVSKVFLFKLITSAVGFIKCNKQTEATCLGQCSEVKSSLCQWDSNNKLCYCSNHCSLAKHPLTCRENECDDNNEGCYWDLHTDSCRCGGPSQVVRCSDYRKIDFTNFKIKYPTTSITCPEHALSNCEWKDSTQTSECIGSCAELTRPEICVFRRCPENPSRSCYWKATSSDVGKCVCFNGKDKCEDNNNSSQCDNSYCPTTTNWMNKLTAKCRWNYESESCSCYAGELAPTTCKGIPVEKCSSVYMKQYPTVNRYCSSGCGLSSNSRICECKDVNEISNNLFDRIKLSLNSDVSNIHTELSYKNILLIVDGNSGIGILSSQPGKMSLTDYITFRDSPTITGIAIDSEEMILYLTSSSGIRIYDVGTGFANPRFLGLQIPNKSILQYFQIIRSNTNHKYVVGITRDALLLISALDHPSYFEVKLSHGVFPTWFSIVPHPDAEMVCVGYSVSTETRFLLISLNGGKEILLFSHPMSTSSGVLSDSCSAAFIINSKGMSVVNFNDKDNQIKFLNDSRFKMKSKILGNIGDGYFSLLIDSWLLLILTFDTQETFFEAQHDMITWVSYDKYKNCLIINHNKRYLSTYIPPVRFGVTSTSIPMGSVNESAVVIVSNLAPLLEVASTPSSSSWLSIVLVSSVVVFVVILIVCFIIVRRMKLSMISKTIQTDSENQEMNIINAHEDTLS